MDISSSLPTTNKHLIRLVEKMADFCQPHAVQRLNGSDEEDAHLKRLVVEAGIFTALDEDKWPGCYYARSRAAARTGNTQQRVHQLGVRTHQKDDDQFRTLRGT
jgi:GTP-dependent phosphoenolpyruvate carboxykinase